MPKKKYAPGARPAVEAGIPAKVVDALIEVLGLDEAEITKDSLLDEDLGADSLDIVELAIELEESYGIAIDDDKAMEWRCVRDVVKTVEPEAVR